MNYRLHIIVSDEAGTVLTNISATKLNRKQVGDYLDMAKPTNEVVPDIEPIVDLEAIKPKRSYKKSDNYRHTGGRREIPVVPPEDFDPKDIE